MFGAGEEGSASKFYRAVIKPDVCNNPLVERLIIGLGLSKCKVLIDFTSGNADCGNPAAYIMTSVGLNNPGQ